ncbi:nicotinate-nucleotide adenylyltransferase [Marinobacter orientalis]|uniref:Probable nicotinate-nucleotide adenylyltransferase n=1 Tax=Marinobacter orientalis TaxID=1928859 RepID=A0A7Y0RD58_9GAMM|nr:nicotinate-nucleotide adenylyltransferase [Marinobacter orientalis]NMT64065.1 nicotinate-nucleotide adenylyltransferase [Marinobacter orientalis]TGX49299.1 nicotinate-nucleotide adenylyltransferase [Marinobacter orientalis]
MHVIYGGTFDPIHHGHLRLAVELRERLGVPEVSLMPCHVPPHRDVPGATSEQRVSLLELAIADEPGLTLDDRELGRNGASYTAETLRQVRAELGPDQPLTMVLGTDSFAGFDRWQEWQRIPELAHIVVVRRPGPGLEPGSVPARLLEERAVDGVEALYHAPCGHILELDTPLLDISATGIRERILSRRSPRYLLPDSVWWEIRRLGLYGA